MKTFAKPFVELTAEERSEILEAFIAGRKVEFLSEDISLTEWFVLFGIDGNCKEFFSVSKKPFLIFLGMFFISNGNMRRRTRAEKSMSIQGNRINAKMHGGPVTKQKR